MAVLYQSDFACHFFPEPTEHSWTLAWTRNALQVLNKIHGETEP